MGLVKICAVARLRANRVAILASGLMLAATQASAHIMPWREGVSRQTGFGTCAKGPCLKRTDFSKSVPHVHLAVNGRDSVVLCTGLQRKPSACATSARHP
jgi:hypothetical protein